MTVRILTGDCREILRTLPDESVHCVVTSPPYFGLRDYGVDGAMGLEASLPEHVDSMVAVFEEVRRILRSDGTLWLNYGDAYAGSRGAQSRGNTTGEASSTLQGSSMLHARQIKAHPKGQTLTGSVKRTPGLKPKDLMGLPWRIAFALQAAGWWLRQDIIWFKPNPMPESISDRCTKAHEYLFLLSKSERYYFDQTAIREPALTEDMRRPFAPGQVDARGNGHDRGGGQLRKIKVRGGWDTGAGAHGTINRSGRTSAQYAERRPKRGLTPRHSQWTSSCDQSGLDQVERGMGRNKRSVWEVATAPFKEAHFATFPPALIEPCILAGCPRGGHRPRPVRWRRHDRPRRRSATARRDLGRDQSGIRSHGAPADRSRSAWADVRVRGRC